MNNNVAGQQVLQEIQHFIQQNPETTEVDLLSMNISGQFFGKRYPITDLEKLTESGIKLPRAMPLMNAMGIPMAVDKYGFGDGDPDHTFFPVPGSLCSIPWDKTPRAQMLVSSAGTKIPLFFEPRDVLSQLLRQCTQQNIYPTVAFELEFYLVDMQRTKEGKIRPPINPVTGKPDSSALLDLERLADFNDCLKEITQSCRQQGIATGALSAELGPGQYELNLEHQSDALLAADQCALFRRTVMSVAKTHGYQATFMAKPYLDCAGNGQHLHISLYDHEDNNLLLTDHEAGLRYAVGGCLSLLPASMAILAPNVNSYRRFESDNCVAVNISWGYENRTTAIRVPESDSQNRRLEHRIAGADSNPYLTLACLLAGMLHGLAQQREPQAPSEGNACAEASGLPTHLRESLPLLAQSDVLQQYLGKAFVDIYCQQKQCELNEYEAEISAREYEWYL